MAVAVATHVDAWRNRLSESIAYWQGEGYRTDVLERGLQQEQPPDVDGLVAMYSAAIDHLRRLEAEATRIDVALGANEVFRDPQRVAEAEELLERAHAGQTPPPGPSTAFTRDTFEVSTSNQIAVGAADSIIAEPGARYNPLFLYGPSGVGKTHLVNAIGNELVASTGGAMNVSVVSTQVFIDELIAALQEGTLDRWRARYRAADALVIDDIQFLAGKERTQEELFHVFNALYAEGKQIVISSDRPPAELESLEDRLRSRFEGGLVAELQSPDRGLREKLYARALHDIQPPPEPGVIQWLAERPASSVREIIGTVNRLVSAADVAGVPISLALARAELGGAGTEPVPAPEAMRASADPFFLDDEKVVWDWPDVGGRVIEEFR
jgi:chromosomal replication initiator protein